MKKKLLIAVLFTVSLSLFAQSIPKASKFMVVNQKSENISSSEENWLPGAVRDKLGENLQHYTDFSFVDSTNISAVKKIQKQSESSGYNESDAIELGKLTVAKYAVFLTLRKSNTSYTVVADVTDLTTGQKIASAISSARKNTDELFSTTGCAADELTVKLCEKLGITLSNTQKYALTHGDEILSNADQLKMAQEEEAAFKNAIAKYDAEIKRLSQSTDLESTASKAKMEADKALAQEKLKASQERAKRLEEEAKKAAADKAEDTARSEAQKKRRDQMAKEAAEKAAAVRKAALDNESIFTKINVIESKKKAVFDIQKSVDDRIAEIKKDGDAEFAKKKKEIMDAPYRAAEKNADGTLSTTAKKRREKQIREMRKEINSNVAKECESVRNIAFKNGNTLYSEIKIDQQNISKTKTVSSLENDLKIQINTFDGITNAWKVTFWLYSNGMPVTSQSIDMTYKDLTGKMIDTSSDRAYDEFMDTVDLYNSFFSRGDPVLTFNLNYKVESVNDSASQYKITLLGVDVMDTVSNSKKVTLNFRNPEIVYQMKPVYDLTEYWPIKAAVVSSRSNFTKYCEIYGGYTKIKEFIIPNGITKIVDDLFYKCTSLTSVTIPDSVTTIGWFAFEGCTSLTSVTIPDSVTKIDKSAFAGCTSLTSVTIPDSVTTIAGVFGGCTSLTSVTIPNSVTTIDSAFERCTSLANITIPDSVTTMGGAFKNCTSLTNVTIPDSVTTIDYAFEDCSSLTSVIIPNSVTMIAGTFKGCTSLTNVTIPNSVTTIKNNAFSDCKSLKSVTIPDSVTTIGWSAFNGCKSLTSITIPNSVTTIEDNAFGSCKSLKSVTISESITTIGHNAFSHCESLKSVTIKAKTPPKLGYDVFSNTIYGYGKEHIYVPAESVGAYKSAAGWKEYAKSIEAMKE